MLYLIALALLTLSFFASERSEALEAASLSLRNSSFNEAPRLAAVRYDIRAQAYEMLVGPLAVGAIGTLLAALWNTFA